MKLLAFFLVTSTCVGFASGASASDCLLPLGLIRSDVRGERNAGCAARIRIQQGQGCLDRSSFERWLADDQPRCWQIARDSRRRVFRPPALDRSHSPEMASVRLELSSRPVTGVGAEALMFLLHRVERQREAFSRAVAPSDPSGWLRSWVVGERTQAAAGSLPASILFSLGFVHLLTTAGVHLLLLSRVLNRVFAGAFSGLEAACESLGVFPGPGSRAWMLGLSSALQWGVFAWAWLLCGMRWGMLRPLFLVGFSRVFLRTGVTLRSPVPLLLAVGCEAGLSLAEWAITPPAELREHGRWHYLAAVWGGAWGARHLEMSVGSWLWVLPLQLFFDGSLSLLNPLLSAVTIPVAGWVLFPCALISVVGLQLMPAFGEWLARTLGGLSQLLLELCVPVAKLPWANWVVDPAWLWPALFVAAAVYFAGGGLRRRVWLAGVGVALALSVRGARPERPVSVMQLDVGQGDSALVLGDSPGLVDAGSARAAREAGWLSMLSRNGVAALDWVVLTHLDEDHAGGLKKLMPWVPIRCIVVPPAAWSERRGLELRRQAAIWGIRTQPRAQGCFPHRWAALSRRSKAPNAGMAGVVVPLGSGGIYLNLGDAGSRAPSREQELASLLLGKDLSRPGPVLFKLSHHGSRHSSDPSWLKRLAPREVWISAALANPHGHPHPEVLERLRQTQIPWRGTWLQGALISN